MWLMLQADEPDDFVVGTGAMHSVQDFVDAAFARAGLDPDALVTVDPALLRPAEVDQLVADPSHAREKLGWEPETSFEKLVAMMVDADLERLAAGAPSRAHGAADALGTAAFTDPDAR
jgi:GDPmannose 4,6-dehydratase